MVNSKAIGKHVRLRMVKEATVGKKALSDVISTSTMGSEQPAKKKRGS